MDVRGVHFRYIRTWRGVCSSVAGLARYSDCARCASTAADRSWVIGWVFRYGSRRDADSSSWPDRVRRNSAMPRADWPVWSRKVRAAWSAADSCARLYSRKDRCATLLPPSATAAPAPALPEATAAATPRMVVTSASFEAELMAADGRARWPPEVWPRSEE